MPGTSPEPVQAGLFAPFEPVLANTTTSRGTNSDMNNGCSVFILLASSNLLWSCFSHDMTWQIVACGIAFAE